MRSPNHLHRNLAHARERSDALFQIVRPDSFYERPIPERHRIIFYLGHLEAFDWNLIGRYALDLPAFHSTFDRLFAFGIDPPPGQLPNDTPSDWPSIEEVISYNQRLRIEIDAVLSGVDPQLVHVAVEHRLMHAETLAYILHQLPYERKVQPRMDAMPVSRDQRIDQIMIEIPAGNARLGRLPEEGFGWDNEFRAHTLNVPAFQIARYKVTNGEYLDFVRQGGPAPFFWTSQEGAWFYRGMFEETPLPLDAPVYVTLRQAQAYANWRNRSIMTEAQFHRAACGAPASSNLDFRYWDPISVQADDAAVQSSGPRQLVGNGWEWTSTAFAPFPGFEPFPFYNNYSLPFFDGDHYVLKGASPRTASAFLRPSFRNWFRPEYPYIYSTFRLVEN